ncbi:hypothetical protein VB773_19455 [Haloarculaceae archaeon H-GB2-1]|nr:hypothetical protein [Haloarculaceae archaeon H-GB11]MEA5409537.1 hypothetical protein [Haloarculaceae archaeon H-GB2-1]
MREIDDTLAAFQDQAAFELQHTHPQQPDRQVALGRYYVVQKARQLLGEAAAESMTTDDLPE